MLWSICANSFFIQVSVGWSRKFYSRSVKINWKSCFLVWFCRVLGVEIIFLNRLEFFVWITSQNVLFSSLFTKTTEWINPVTFYNVCQSWDVFIFWQTNTSYRIANFSELFLTNYVVVFFRRFTLWYVLLCSDFTARQL